MSTARVVSVQRVPIPEPEVIELVAIAPCTAAAIGIGDCETVRFVREAGDAAMVVVVADARCCVTIAPPKENLHARTAIAVVAVESVDDFDPEWVSPDFDAVLPVAVGNGASDDALAKAVHAVVAFATSGRVSIPVDEANRFFIGAGRLFLGRGRAPTIASALRAAVRDSGGPRRGRFLVHAEIGGGEIVQEIRQVTTALRDLRTDDLLFSISESRDEERRATVLVAAGRVGRFES